MNPSWLAKRWFFRKEESHRSAAEKEKIRKKFSAPPPIDHPEDAEEPFNAIDTGGYYWLNGAGSESGRPIARRLREGVINKATANTVSRDVNPHEKGAPTVRREFNTYRIWDLLSDSLTPQFDPKAFAKALEPHLKPKKK